MRTLARACALVCAFNLAVSLLAQVTVGPANNGPAQSASAQLMSDALKFRSDAADAVAKGNETPDVTIGQLRANISPSGLSIDPNADFALAAIDVGHRLAVKGQGRQAVAFFRAAEQALGTLANNTPDSSPGLKAFYLKQLAFIRGSYLNEADQAKLDIEKAVSLQPNDNHLKQVKQFIANEHGAIFKDVPTFPKKG